MELQSNSKYYSQKIKSLREPQTDKLLISTAQADNSKTFRLRSM